MADVSIHSLKERKRYFLAKLLFMHFITGLTSKDLNSSSQWLEVSFQTKTLNFRVYPQVLELPYLDMLQRGKMFQFYSVISTECSV